ncbi:MAG: hypothetical protein AAF443_06905, partial [Chlamydiota bacterium]
LTQNPQEAGCLSDKQLDNFGPCPGYYYFSQKGYVDTFGSQATASRRKDHMLVSELLNNYTQGTLSSQSPKRDEDSRVSSLKIRCVGNEAANSLYL